MERDPYQCAVNTAMAAKRCNNPYIRFTDGSTKELDDATLHETGMSVHLPFIRKLSSSRYTLRPVGNGGIFVKIRQISSKHYK